MIILKKTIAFMLALAFTLTLLATSFIKIDAKKVIVQKWLLTELKINKQTFSEEVLAQKQKAIGRTILEFLPNGIVYLHIKTPKSKMITQTNRWQIDGEKSNKLIIQSKAEGEPTSQIFEIIKISPKKMVLMLKEGKDVQIFTYKPYKP